MITQIHGPFLEKISEKKQCLFLLKKALSSPQRIFCSFRSKIYHFVSAAVRDEAVFPNPAAGIGGYGGHSPHQGKHKYGGNYRADSFPDSHGKPSNNHKTEFYLSFSVSYVIIIAHASHTPVTYIAFC